MVWSWPGSLFINQILNPSLYLLPFKCKVNGLGSRMGVLPDIRHIGIAMVKGYVFKKFSLGGYRNQTVSL